MSKYLPERLFCFLQTPTDTSSRCGSTAWQNTSRVFINIHHVHSSFVLHYQRTTPPRLSANYPSREKEDIIHSVASDYGFSVKWKYSSCELIITVFPAPFPWSHPLVPPAAMNLSLPPPREAAASLSSEDEAGPTPLTKLTCCRVKCHNFICAKFNNMARWSSHNVAIRFLSFQFLILLSQYANSNLHSCKV